MFCLDDCLVVSAIEVETPLYDDVEIDAPPIAPEAPQPKPAGKPKARQIEFTTSAPLPAILKVLPGQRQHWLRWDRKRK
jgi:hypothetical protein